MIDAFVTVKPGDQWPTDRPSFRHIWYLFVRGLPTLLIVGGYPLAVSWATGTSWVVAAALAVSGSLAIYPYLLTRIYGSVKDIAASRTDLRFYWGVVVVAVFANVLTDQKGSGSELIGAGLAGLAVFGLIAFMLTNARRAAEVAAVAKDQDNAPSVDSRYEMLACAQRDWWRKNDVLRQFQLGLFGLMALLIGAGGITAYQEGGVPEPASVYFAIVVPLFLAVGVGVYSRWLASKVAPATD